MRTPPPPRPLEMRRAVRWAAFQPPLPPLPQVRRLVFGLREVKRGAKSKTLRCVVIAPNIDEGTGLGGLDENVRNPNPNSKLGGLDENVRCWARMCARCVHAQRAGRRRQQPPTIRPRPSPAPLIRAPHPRPSPAPLQVREIIRSGSL